MAKQINILIQAYKYLEWLRRYTDPLSGRRLPPPPHTKIPYIVSFPSPAKLGTMDVTDASRGSYPVLSCDAKAQQYLADHLAQLISLAAEGWGKP